MKNTGSPSGTVMTMACQTEPVSTPRRRLALLKAKVAADKSARKPASTDQSLVGRVRTKGVAGLLRTRRYPWQILPRAAAFSFRRLSYMRAQIDLLLHSILDFVPEHRAHAPSTLNGRHHRMDDSRRDFWRIRPEPAHRAICILYGHTRVALPISSKPSILHWIGQRPSSAHCHS